MVDQYIFLKIGADHDHAATEMMCFGLGVFAFRSRWEGEDETLHKLFAVCPGP